MSTPTEERAQTFIHELANGILDTFQRHHIPHHIALAAVAVVAGDLLDRVPKQLAADWVHGFQAVADA